MTQKERVPEGMVDAHPPGGRADGDVADTTTAEADRAAQGSSELIADGDAPAGPVETDTVGDGTDPDLATDDEQSGQDDD